MKTILFQGDSITDAQRNRSSDQHPGSGYPTVVNALLGSEKPGEVRFLNRGISGARIVDVYSRIKSDIINLKPDMMSILIGVNDVWHELGGHNGVDAEKFERIYDMLIEEIKEALPDIQIMLIAPFVLEGNATRANENEPDRWDIFRTEVARRAEATFRVAEKYGLPCIDVQALLDAACEKTEPAWWLYDGVHPSPAGHGLIAKAWLETYNKYFA